MRAEQNLADDPAELDRVHPSRQDSSVYLWRSKADAVSPFCDRRGQQADQLRTIVLASQHQN